jgi:hypothetical protein
VSRPYLAGLAVWIAITAYSVVMLAWVATGALEPAGRLLGGGS